MTIEIEKTFLVKKIPKNLSSFKSQKIKQGYLSPAPSPLRIRQKGDKFELTKKIPIQPGDFSLAEETNIFLTKYEFNKLWPLTEKSLECSIVPSAEIEVPSSTIKLSPITKSSVLISTTFPFLITLQLGLVKSFNFCKALRLRAF